MAFNLIAFETSTTTCSVALLTRRDGRLHVACASHESQGHAEHVLPLAQRLLDQAGLTRNDLDLVAFGQGPGGFTGLRVACGVAQGIAYALGVPVVPVPTLQAIAAAAGPAGVSGVCRIVVQDARMNELYVAAYWLASPAGEPSAAWQEVQPCVLIAAEDFLFWLDQQARSWSSPGPVGWVEMTGDGIQAHPALKAAASVVMGGNTYLVQLLMESRFDAGSIALQGLQLFESGKCVTPSEAAPLYVRDKVAFTTQERQKGLGGNPRVRGKLRIEPMRPEHLDEVVDIEASVQSFPWTRGNFADALSAGYGAWVALQDDKVVGFSVVMFAPDVAHLLVIAVAPRFQRGGVGYVLLRHSEQAARDHGLISMLLEVRRSNAKALNFYHNRGFQSLSVRKGYYPAAKSPREDALVLQKDLSEGGHHDGT
ncbi:MAG TPA: bifunctional tRNA (adenosine(37)-N6)-threonylcarbamoyltransferase complex dimerization subunit type 1 TsaB/ribosomal-protein-alanine acetyltransferase RimI [Pusillimonas sp.]|nr:bifunctional tRNA (adenosine(37)-N6)-threonylcarbamoyltransferase complex dimerization subunit type 1 TsaB/ribosomal-protein-alanine acetyltransferase RimI [Pusillimonas sp.]